MLAAVRGDCMFSTVPDFEIFKRCSWKKTKAPTLGQVVRCSRCKGAVQASQYPSSSS